MSQTKSWRPLPLRSSSELPVLLVSFYTDTAAYVIHVTDMVNMWTETLDRKAIFMRGWSENTSIDPSDTPDNMAKFLTSLIIALDASQPGHVETSLHLDRDSRSDTDANGLTLNITCNLPGLQPLKWPMYLKKLPASNIATDLVYPLIQAYHAKNLEIDSLIRTLGHKDVVLTKLLDKLEAMGTGLEHVFNALSGKKKVSRATAADKVPGLAPFDRRRWKSELTYMDNAAGDTNSLVQSVFGDGGLQFEPMETRDSSQLDEWWRNFRGATSIAREPQQKVALSKEKSPPPKDIEPVNIQDDDDNDFQVQATPPHLCTKEKSTDAKNRPPTIDDASTEGDACSPASARSVSPLPRKSKVDKPARRLGALGRKKQSTPPLSPKRIQPRSKVKPPAPMHDDSETASETEDISSTALPQPNDPSPSPPLPSQPEPITKKSGLGRIGGPKSKRPAERTSNPPEDKTTESTPAGVPHHLPKKLGVIGKQNGNDGKPAAAADELSRRGRSTTKEAEDLTPRETSQERADRRREELKKELEKKAAAGPAKKKRKF
ncbi:hypothetical protein F66182_781 [Fusarium sp. NRRL 66182]|nr:hypothetical protein F66182_781 [Fusarium sp. NRRL 66182]